MREEAQCYAVLTGDIVKSTSLQQQDFEFVRSCLLDAVGQARNWKRGLVKGKAEFFRGDAWQLLLAHPATVLRVSVFLRASLLADGKADTRISIGLGEVEAMSASRISLSTGQAFVESGRGLDRMTQYSKMTIEVPKSTGVFSDWLPVVGALCDSLVSQWTQRQAEIICLAICPDEPTQEEIAERLSPPVSRQAVTKALDIANWHSVRSLIRLFEATDWAALLHEKPGSASG